MVTSSTLAVLLDAIILALLIVADAVGQFAWLICGYRTSSLLTGCLFFAMIAMRFWQKKKLRRSNVPTMTVLYWLERAGCKTSTTQLTAWVRQGLIPKHLYRKHGQGRGHGVVFLWEPEALARAIIISKSLEHGRHRLEWAKEMLQACGYTVEVTGE